MPRDPLLKAASILTLLLPLVFVWTVPADIAITLVALLFLAKSFRDRDFSWCREGWFVCLGALWVYISIRSGFSEIPKEAYPRTLPFIRYAVFAAALGRWTLADPWVRKRFGWVLSLLVLFYALDGLLQWVVGFDIFLRRSVHLSVSDHLRLTGPFTKPILGIMLTWLAFPAMLPMLIDDNGQLKKGRALIMGLAYAVVILALIVLSGERMALMLTLMGGLLSVLLLPLPRRIVFTGLGGMVLLLAALALASPEVLHRQIDSTAETLAHWHESAYGMIFDSDVAVIKGSPVIGVGAGQFLQACSRLYPGDATAVSVRCSTHPHNIYLEWLVEEGVIGFVLFCAAVLCVLASAIRAYPVHRASPLYVGLLIAFTYRAWPFMSSTGFFSRWGAPPFWLVLGALLVYTAGQRGSMRDAGPDLAV